MDSLPSESIEAIGFPRYAVLGNLRTDGIPMTQILQTGPVALYGQLASIFRDKIFSGVWREGYEIPTLEQLTEEYGLARVTVRQAIQILADEGLLLSHRGRRTRVTFSAEKLNASPLFTSINFTNSVTGNYRVEVISVDQIDGDAIPEVFAGIFRGNYTLVRKVDFESGSPYSTSWNYIRTDIFDRFPAKKGVGVTKIARLMREIGGGDFSKCLERISVDSASTEIARLLQVNTGSTLGEAKRVFMDDGGTIAYFGRLYYPGSKFGIERDITQAIKL